MFSLTCMLLVLKFAANLYWFLILQEQKKYSLQVTYDPPVLFTYVVSFEIIKDLCSPMSVVYFCLWNNGPGDRCLYSRVTLHQEKVSWSWNHAYSFYSAQEGGRMIVLTIVANKLQIIRKKKWQCSASQQMMPHTMSSCRRGLNLYQELV